MPLFRCRFIRAAPPPLLRRYAMLPLPCRRAAIITIDGHTLLIACRAAADKASAASCSPHAATMLLLLPLMLRYAMRLRGCCHAAASATRIAAHAAIRHAIVYKRIQRMLDVAMLLPTLPPLPSPSPC